MDTGSRKWGRPYLNRRFFSLIGERMADRILLIFAMRHGQPIAGALNFIGSDTLYGRYWGTTADQPFLHFELCYYQAIEWGIDHGLKLVEAGAQGEHKLARGYRPIDHLLGPLDRRSRLPHAPSPTTSTASATQVARDQEALAEYLPFREEDGSRQ